jgi:hypothetical protein
MQSCMHTKDPASDNFARIPRIGHRQVWDRKVQEKMEYEIVQYEVFGDMKAFNPIKFTWRPP